MKSWATSKFWDAFAELPSDVQGRARRNFQLWLLDQRHPSLHFNRVVKFWSVRIDRNFRALAIGKDGDFFWIWIGDHKEYDRLIK